MEGQPSPEDSQCQETGFSIPSPVTFLETSLTPRFQPFFSNTQMRTYIFHLKTQNLPRFHSCPTTALILPFPPSKLHFWKNSNFSYLIYSPVCSNFDPSLSFHQEVSPGSPRSSSPGLALAFQSLHHVAPFELTDPFFSRRYSFSLVSVISPSPDLPPLLPSFHCLFSLCLFSSAQMQAKPNLSSNLVMYQTEMLSRFRHHSVPQLSQP